jgi:hypothetical protein
MDSHIAMTCPCGLEETCPDGYVGAPDTPITCPHWLAHVQDFPWWQRAVAWIVALFQRW